MSEFITKKQRSVLDDIFIDGLSESSSLKKNRINANTYRQWLNDQIFQKEIQFYIDSAQRQGKILIARHCEFAAAKLVQLAGSDKDETARKACLDIIKASKNPENKNKTTEEPAEPKMDLSPDKAAKILEIMAGK